VAISLHKTLLALPHPTSHISPPIGEIASSASLIAMT